jgi:hypothetical protein
MRLQTLQIRANVLLKSLRCFYAGLGLFAVSALIAVGGCVASYYGQKLSFELTAVLAVATGTSAVMALCLTKPVWPCRACQTGGDARHESQSVPPV